MPSPSQSWTAINATDIDQDSPLTTTLIANLYNNLVHLKEVLYGTGSYTGTIPHDHDGAEDAAVSAAFTGNLVMNSAPDDNGDANWDYDCDVESDKGFLFTASNAQYASQIVTTRAELSKVIFGSNGADMVLSCYVRGKTSAPTAGSLDFGLADGSNTTYLANCKANVGNSAITTTWKRFYMTLSAKGASATTDIRFLIKSNTMNQDVLVSGIQLSIGSVLSYWEPAILEDQDTHNDWKYFGITDLPIFDKTVSITNATSIAGA